MGNLVDQVVGAEKANDKLQLYTVEGREFKELAEVRQEHKSLTAILAKTDEEYHENGPTGMGRETAFESNRRDPG